MALCTFARVNLSNKSLEEVQWGSPIFFKNGEPDAAGELHFVFGTLSDVSYNARDWQFCGLVSNTQVAQSKSLTERGIFLVNIVTAGLFASPIDRRANAIVGQRVVWHAELGSGCGAGVFVLSKRSHACNREIYTLLLRSAFLK